MDSLSIFPFDFRYPTDDSSLPTPSTQVSDASGLSNSGPFSSAQFPRANNDASSISFPFPPTPPYFWSEIPGSSKFNTAEFNASPIYGDYIPVAQPQTNIPRSLPRKNRVQKRRTTKVSKNEPHAGAAENRTSTGTAVEFVNLTIRDAKKITAAVARSGSFKTKTKRANEAQQKEKQLEYARQLSAAALRAVRASGGDTASLVKQGFFICEGGFLNSDYRGNIW
jgi:hypothetical protein